MMQTNHNLLFQKSQAIPQIADDSVGLVVTSPPYPMVGMWDDVFSNQNPGICDALGKENGDVAFELMHQELDKVWAEVYRTLTDGGIACINIGDATRSLSGNFQLYNNHSRILHRCLELGFQSLPPIIWRKQTNAPNKFMGSGMLPPGAYVTLEHEYILVLRKGHKREFKSPNEKSIRQESAYFWEERNEWFSDVWTGLNGARQALVQKDLRDRSGAYPFELAFRLINMYSVKGDLVLDPFLGTGTTTLASIASERNSIGVEVDENFSLLLNKRIPASKMALNEFVAERLSNHYAFVRNRTEQGKAPGYTNNPHGFGVVTRQEKEACFRLIESIEVQDNGFAAAYNPSTLRFDAPLFDVGREAKPGTNLLACLS